MTEAKVTALRSIELGVPDLKASMEFYTSVWGLEAVTADGDAVYLRGTGAEHHVVTLRQQPKASLLGVHFAASSRQAVDQLHAKAMGYGATVISAPISLPGAAGGGYGFAFRTPDGQPLNISADVSRHTDVLQDSSRPKGLTHVVLNSADVGKQTSFFVDLLGFKLSDSTEIMEFIRCGTDHHSVALARGQGPSLNHMAYEMDDIDGLMLGSGRMKRSGFNLEWGVGRHGPGNNIFSYFIEPNGFVTEYTTGMEHIEDANYSPGTADYWSKFPLRPCRWGMAMRPSDRIKKAMAGRLESDAETTPLCEDVIARKRAGQASAEISRQ
jgi:catechol 2,3-dioxygenase